MFEQERPSIAMNVRRMGSSERPICAAGYLKSEVLLGCSETVAWSNFLELWVGSLLCRENLVLLGLSA